MTHMKKLLIIILLAVTGNPALYGQNTILEKINEIKSQTDTYYWNEYTHPDADTAVVNAYKRVLITISCYQDEEPSADELIPKMKHIKMKRGNLTRVFAYIKKSDIGHENITPTNSLSIVTQPLQPAFVPDAFVQIILQKKEFFNVYDYLKEMKAQGQILQFGPLKEVEDYSSLELILFDMQSKEVLTLLSPAIQGDVRTNLTTGTEYSLDNYPEDMLLVIWYIK